jgi:nucleoside-diphosphate-sugar epimerase
VGCPYICFTSSISVYGPTEEPRSEAAQPAPNSDYGRSKLLAEQIHRHWLSDSSERRLIIVRPAVVFGRGEHGNFTRLAHALERRRFAYAGRTDVIKSCGYVGEFAHVLRFAEALGRRELTLNFCYPARYTIEDICRTFADVAGYHTPPMIPPMLMSSVLKTLRVINPADKGTVSAARVAKLTASTNIVPVTLQDLGYTWHSDLPAAIKDWYADSGGGSFL